jgi:hypothetical protein
MLASTGAKIPVSVSQPFSDLQAVVYVFITIINKVQPWKVFIFMVNDYLVLMMKSVVHVHCSISSGVKYTTAKGVA